MAESLSTPAAPDDRYRQWHRLFGLLLMDYLSDSPFTVEVEKDLSTKIQRLDVIVVRRRPGRLTLPLPDGLNDFVAHNLISFKSFHEPLDDWALKELTGHYVNYRKLVSPKNSLLPENRFRLYAVCARHPRQLLSLVSHEKVQEGVYRIGRGTDDIRVVVAGDLPHAEQNSLLHLFSAAPEQVEYGKEHYRRQSQQTSSIIGQLFESYRQEGVDMSYTMNDFMNDLVRERLPKLSPEERLRGLPAKERLAGLSPKEIEDYLRGLQKQPSAAKKKRPRSSK